MKRIQSIILGLLLPLFLMAQSGSPSSRFGYGEMSDNVPGELRAMGGVVTAMRSNHTINPAQPASYTAGDSLSFMFDMGVRIGWTNYKDAYGTKNIPLGSLEYLTMQFPLWKRWIAFSCGILPFTHVNYDFTLSSQTKTGSETYTINYSGQGGLSQVYAGLGFNILNWAAVGANFYYMFGTPTNYIIQTFSSSDAIGSQVIQYMDMNAFRTKIGAQVFHTFGKHNVVLGATFDPKLPLGGEFYTIEVNFLDTVAPKTGSETPMAWSVGACYTWNNRLTISSDYSRQDWQRALYFGKTNQLYDRQKVTLGAQYQHNMYGLKYSDRMIWRVGASMMTNYAQSNDWKDFSVSMGFGFPLRTTASIINTTFEYSRRRSLVGADEHTLNMIIDVAINEMWFHKRKL